MPAMTSGISRLRLLLLVILIAGVPLPAAGSTPAAPASPCSAPEARQFDFWIGE